MMVIFPHAIFSETFKVAHAFWAAVICVVGVQISKPFLVQSDKGNITHGESHDGLLPVSGHQ